MDWRRVRLHGRPSLDHRFDLDVPDRADKWLRAVESRQRERRNTLTAPSSAIAVRSSK